MPTWDLMLCQELEHRPRVVVLLIGVSCFDLRPKKNMEPAIRGAPWADFSLASKLLNPGMALWGCVCRGSAPSLGTPREPHGKPARSPSFGARLRPASEELLLDKKKEGTLQLLKVQKWTLDFCWALFQRPPSIFAEDTPKRGDFGPGHFGGPNIRLLPGGLHGLPQGAVGVHGAHGAVPDLHTSPCSRTCGSLPFSPAAVATCSWELGHIG